MLSISSFISAGVYDFGKYRYSCSLLNITLVISPFLISPMISLIFVPVSFFSRLNFFILCAWEMDGTACVSTGIPFSLKGYK